jgi:hypothetical protein
LFPFRGTLHQRLKLLDSPKWLGVVFLSGTVADVNCVERGPLFHDRLPKTLADLALALH